MPTNPTPSANRSNRVRFPLQAKLTLAFVSVSLVGFVVAFLLLPSLYLRSKIREIEASKPHNVEVLRQGVYAPSQGQPLADGEIVRSVLIDSTEFDLRGREDSRPFGLAATLDLIREKTTGSSSDDLRAAVESVSRLFPLFKYFPEGLPSLEERLSLWVDEASGEYFVPLLIPFEAPEKGIDGTLALGNHFEDPLLFDPLTTPSQIFRVIENFLEGDASEILFLTAKEIKESNPDLWELAMSKRDLPYWDAEARTERGRIQLYIPVDNLSEVGELAGLFCILYEPTAGLVAWKELASGQAYLALAIAALMAIVASLFIAKGITRPVLELTRTALDLSEGNLEGNVAVATRDEIGVLAGTFNEMTLRLRATLAELEEQNLELDRGFTELRALQTYTENVLSTVESGIFSVDLEGKVRSPNRAARDLLDMSDGNSMEALESEALRERLRAALETGESTVSDEVTVLSSTGEKVPIALSVSVLREEDRVTGSVAVLTDLQTIKNLEALVSRQERLAALGQLTAGVAHEIRNPLSIIKACAELLDQKFSSHPDENGLCADILEETNRLSRVVTDFLMFARPSEPNPERVGLNDIIETTAARLDRGIEKRSSIRCDLVDPPPLIEADADQVEQVLLNLIRNADEAMAGEGEMVLRTGISEERGTAWFEVEDRGEGMDAETLRRVFDPFYTSKPQGTGLGLSICHRILESHRGGIEVVSAVPGSGTTIRATFPKAADKVINRLHEEPRIG